MFLLVSAVTRGPWLRLANNRALGLRPARPPRMLCCMEALGEAQDGRFRSPLLDQGGIEGTDEAVSEVGGRA